MWCHVCVNLLSSLIVKRSRVFALKGIVSLLVVIVLLALAFAIGSQNEAVITVNYLIAQADIRLSTLIAIAVSIGIIVGLLIMLVSWLGLRMQLLAARSRIKKLTKE